LFRIVFVVFALLALAVPAFAHQGHDHNLLGTIKAAEGDQLVVTRRDGTETTLQLTGETKIRGIDGKKAERSELAPGRRVSIYLDDTEKIAVRIRIGAPAR
jgi:hypothetical protein